MRVSRPDESDKRQFAAMLNRRLRERKMTKTALAEATGMSLGAIKLLSNASSFPLPENAAKIAEALDSEGLLALSRIKVQCPICEKGFYLGSRRERAYCSARCRSTAQNRVQRESRKAKKPNEYFRRGKELDLYHESVEMHCLECTGGSPVCETAGCKLRPVSPLPLRERSNAYTPPSAPTTGRPLLHPRGTRQRLVQRVR